MIAVLYPTRALVTVSIFSGKRRKAERQVTITQSLKKIKIKIYIKNEGGGEWKQ